MWHTFPFEANGLSLVQWFCLCKSILIVESYSPAVTLNESNPVHDLFHVGYDIMR